MKKRMYHVYILTNNHHTVLYTGVTNNLQRRIQEHKTKFNKGFTAKYNVSKLVYHEQFSSIREAIKREKRIKKWKREWKEELIEGVNPGWVELSCEVY
jgi:putative endonuclease